jgi:hypothetical protein
MWPRCRELEVGIVCLAVMSFGCQGQAQDLTTRATGCLGSDGNLSRFALGDDPLEGCPDGTDQVSLKLDDLSDGAATVPFFITLRFGEEQIIAENGALALHARCILGLDTSGNALELVVTSTLDGWLATSAGSSTTTENLAEDEVTLFTARGQPDQGRLSGFGSDRLTGAQLALAPDGSFLALAPGSTALGVDLFNQDCLAVGTANLIRGDVSAPLTPGERLQRPDQFSGPAAISGGISGAAGSDGIAVGVGTDGGIAGSTGSAGGGISQLGGGIPQVGGGISPLGGGISPLGGGISPLGGGISPLGGGISRLGE